MQPSLAQGRIVMMGTGMNSSGLFSILPRRR